MQALPHLRARVKTERRSVHAHAGGLQPANNKGARRPLPTVAGLREPYFFRLRRVATPAAIRAAPSSAMLAGSGITDTVALDDWLIASE